MHTQHPKHIYFVSLNNKQRHAVDSECIIYNTDLNGATVTVTAIIHFEKENTF